MKLLFDQNLSFKLCQRLSDVFPDSSQARLLGLAEADDKVLWERAMQDGCIIVTQDADFAELSALLGPPPKVLWLRCGNQTTPFIENLLRRSLSKIQQFDGDPTMSCLEIY